jgi:hypothetical protein
MNDEWAASEDPPRNGRWTRSSLLDHPPIRFQKRRERTLCSLNLNSVPSNRGYIVSLFIRATVDFLCGERDRIEPYRSSCNRLMDTGQSFRVIVDCLYCISVLSHISMVCFYISCRKSIARSSKWLTSRCSKSLVLTST